MLDHVKHDGFEGDSKIGSVSLTSVRRAHCNAPHAWHNIEQLTLLTCTNHLLGNSNCINRCFARLTLSLLSDPSGCKMEPKCILA